MNAGIRPAPTGRRTRFVVTQWSVVDHTAGTIAASSKWCVDARFADGALTHHADGPRFAGDVSAFGRAQRAESVPPLSPIGRYVYSFLA
jgi:hypothetical protein